MYIKSTKFTALVIILFFTIQVHAAAAVCPTASNDSTKNVRIEGLKATPKLISTNKQKKTKSSASYFGLFKMLIPNTLK